MLFDFLKWTIHVGCACMTRETTHEDDAAPESFNVIVPSFSTHIKYIERRWQKGTLIDAGPFFGIHVVTCRHHLFSLEFRQELDEDPAHYLRGPHLLQQVRNCAQLSAVQLCAIVRNCAIAPAQNRRIQCNSHYTVLYHREKVVPKKRLRRVDDL